MRFLILIAVLALAACSTEELAAPGLQTGTYRGEGRDALCLAGGSGAQTGGFVVYGTGDANCSVRGTLAQQDKQWTLTPNGDADCRIALSVDNGRIALGPGTAACAYYCGPDASFVGKSFTKNPSDDPKASDFGGETLC